MNSGRELGVRDRGFFISFASIDTVIVYLGKTCNYAKVMQLERMTYKGAAHDDYMTSIRKDTCAKILSSHIINKGREEMVQATHRGILFQLRGCIQGRRS